MDPKEQLVIMRRRILAGGRPTTDSLSREEMEAVGDLIRTGDAKIISVNCRPTVAHTR